MLKNYIVITLRTLSREKAYALINIVGLSLALACTIILGLYIRSELSYDRHNLDHERIARVVAEIDTNGQALRSAIVSPALGPLVLRSYPQAGEYVRFHRIGVNAETVLRAGDTEYSWEDVYFADAGVFDIFTHNAVYGDLNNALSDPASIVVSESLARTYWGDLNPLGEVIEVDGSPYQVSAVFEDLPENSHLKYDALLPYEVLLASFGRTNETLSPGNLLVQMDFTYFKVPEDFGLQELEQTLNRYYADNAEELGGRIGMHINYRVQALADVHFDAGWDYDEPGGNIFYLYGFSAVALFILLVACINYTNLAIARATKRAKEVGMRKVLGAERKQLVAQFLGESLVYTSIALCLSLLLVEIVEQFTAVPSLIGKQELLSTQSDPSILVWLGLFSLSVALLAGLYPAFYLASISPKAALTAVQRGRASKFSIRESLVLVQFFVSIAVVACTLLMALQMEYVSNKPLGFEKENRILVQLRGADVLEKLPVIRNELLSNPHITGVAESTFVPGGRTGWSAASLESNDGQMEDGSLRLMQVSDDFVDVMGMEIVKGRVFSKDQLSDADTSVIVNESLVRKMNWENPLAKRIILRAGGGEKQVIAVVKDFHFASLRQSVQPAALQPFPNRETSDGTDTRPGGLARALIIQLSGQDVAEALSHLESVMRQFDPDNPFEFEFFEDALNRLYISDERLMALTGIFSLVCIFIASMGLYGLSAFNTEQRTKEIGVRKVLGASAGSIVLMLAKKQLVLIGLSAVLASIVSYLAIENWLTAFAYRAEIATWVFFVSALFVALVAFVTIALQSWNIAQRNPVEALRYE